MLRYDFICNLCGSTFEQVVKTSRTRTVACTCGGRGRRTIVGGSTRNIKTNDHFSGWTGEGERWEHLLPPNRKRMFIRNRAHLVEVCEQNGIAQRDRGGWEGDCGPRVLLGG